jgi:hypothetical protein
MSKVGQVALTVLMLAGFRCSALLRHARAVHGTAQRVEAEAIASTATELKGLIALDVEPFFATRACAGSWPRSACR